MGGGTGGSYSTAANTLDANLKTLAKQFSMDENGQFGTPGKGKWAVG